MNEQNNDIERFFHLSKRDFLKVCGTSSVGLLLAACGYPSTTATISQILTVTPTNTKTPFPTGTPSPTPTNKPTFVHSPTPVETIFPWEKERKTTVFITDFEMGLTGFSNTEKPKGTNDNYEVVNDPIQSGKGKLYLGRVFGKNPQNDVHQPFPSYYPEKFIEGSFGTEFDVYLDGSLTPKQLGPGKLHRSPWIRILTIYDRSPFVGDTWLNDSIYLSISGSSNRYFLLTWLNGQHHIMLDSFSNFPLGKWIKVGLFVDSSSKKVFTFQDNKLVSSGIYPARRKLGFAGAHWGLETSNFIESAQLYNDNISIITYD